MFKGLKGLIAGLLAGTAVGILFAPKKGEETRNKIKSEIKRGGTGLSAVKETLEGVGKDIGGTCNECMEDERVKKYANMAKKEAKELINKNVSKSTINKAKKTFNNAKKFTQNAVNKVEKVFKK
ncbi:YtxH domain-containing protein [Candidatus Gracilibacteria bacterium]|jgi:gas vesicle protein|nr:YtxH domain-containing protein [Candidatus Gracilibacteria bacterium]